MTKKVIIIGVGAGLVHAQAQLAELGYECIIRHPSQGKDFTEEDTNTDNSRVIVEGDELLTLTLTNPRSMEDIMKPIQYYDYSKEVKIHPKHQKQNKYNNK